jgi:hypothetical protein
MSPDISCIVSGVGVNDFREEILTLSSEYFHRFLMKLENIGVNEGKNTLHFRFLAKQSFVLHQERHVLSNLTVSVEYRLKTISPRACSLQIALSACYCLDEYSMGNRRMPRADLINEQEHVGQL